MCACAMSGLPDQKQLINLSNYITLSVLLIHITVTESKFCFQNLEMGFLQHAVKRDHKPIRNKIIMYTTQILPKIVHMSHHAMTSDLVT